MVASLRHETLGFVLSVRTLEALHHHHSTLVFLCRKRAAKILKSFSRCTVSTSWYKAGRLRQAPTVGRAGAVSPHSRRKADLVLLKMLRIAAVRRSPLS